MSEGSPELSGTGTGQEDTGDPGAGTAQEDQEASDLLGGMAEQDDEQAAQLAHWKDMARKHERRAKENAGAAAKLQELEDANKTEIQKAQDAAAEAIRERDAARADHSRVMAAAASNLPVDLIDHLGSGTDEEITERAALFASVIETRAREMAEEMIAEAGGGRNGLQGARPVESMRPGSAPAGGSAPKNLDDWFRNLVTRE